MVTSHLGIWAVSVTKVLCACGHQRAVTAPCSLWCLAGSSGCVLSQPLLGALGAGSAGEGWGCERLLSLFPSVGSTSSSPALLGIREPRSDYDRTHPSMQYYSSQGDVVAHKDIYTGKRPAEILWSRELFLIGRAHSGAQTTPNRCFPFPFLVLPGCGTGQALLFSVKLPSTRVNTDPFLFGR